MCPSIAVLAGGGDGGGGSGGSGQGGDGQGPGGGSGSADGAAGDGRTAPAGAPGSPQEGHPVDVVTGDVWTMPALDLWMDAPLPFNFFRRYRSASRERDVGLGHGWSHSLGWQIVERRDHLRVWSDEGIRTDFPNLVEGERAIGPFGMLVSRVAAGYELDAGDGLTRVFEPLTEDRHIHCLTAVRDRNGNATTLEYDRGRLVLASDSAGRRIRFMRSSRGQIAAVAVLDDEDCWVTFATYEYDEAENLRCVTDADGHSARFTYDEDHRLTSETDRVGLTFHFLYDSSGRCIETWGDRADGPDPSLAPDLPPLLADGRTPARGIYHRRLEYLPGRYTEVADSTTTRRYEGNVHGTADKVVGAGGVTTCTYDERGHVLSMTDQIGSTTRVLRDERGRVVLFSDPLHREYRIDRDPHGLPLRLRDPMGGVHRFERDTCGNVLISEDPIGHVESHEYDRRGLRIETRLRSGGVVRMRYDDRGNLVEQTLPNGLVRSFTYDAFGRRLSAVDPSGDVTRYTYSARGDLIAVERRDGTRAEYRYDGEGRLLSERMSDGSVITHRWGGVRKLVERRDAGGNRVLLSYNREGELLAVDKGNGELHRYVRDALGRVIEEVTFDRRTIRYRYDAAGRCIAIREGTHATTNAYDAAGQLVMRELAGGDTVAFAYDAHGAMVSAASASGKVHFTRDALGRIVEESQSTGGETHTVQYRYDPEGNIVERRTSLGHHVVFERDTMGSIVRTVLDGTDEIVSRHDAYGREVTRVLSDVARIDSTFDTAGRLLRRTIDDGQSVSARPAEPRWIGEPIAGAVDHRYRYDALSRVVEAAREHDDTVSYRYDDSGRLIAAGPEGPKEQRFAYDTAGNPRFDAEARVYDPGGRLRNKGETTYAWDTLGRLRDKTQRLPDGRLRRWTYGWNDEGSLREVSAPDGTSVRFTYDPFGRRLEKIVRRRERPGDQPALVSRTRFVWDGPTLLHEICERSGEQRTTTEDRTFLYGDTGFAPIGHRAGGVWYHYVNGPTGTPEKIVDRRGQVHVALQWSAWGRTTQTTPGAAPARTPLRLQGQYADEETGLHYNRYRYYDPDTAQFISPDPIGLRGGFQLYAFPTDPINQCDPLGLAWPPQPMPPEVASLRQQASAAGAAHRPGFDAALHEVQQQHTGADVGRGFCNDLAHAYARQNPGSTVITMEPQRGLGLQTYQGVSNASSEQSRWPAHAAVQMPPIPGGPVHDPDQRMVFPNQQAWMNSVAPGARVRNEAGVPPDPAPTPGRFGGPASPGDRDFF
ncbi:MAG: RHS repeat protein [Polyangiaceae bacterium]|nr:RHS repeat protein [Polyangiaceae bacterium]